MKEWLKMPKNKDVVEYLEDSHTYLVNGVIVPPVTHLVSFATGDEYKNVPEHILEKARKHGTAVHEAIENYINTKEISKEYAQQVEDFIKISKKQMLLVKDMEQIVHFGSFYAGRYDICDMLDEIWDIKTTSKKKEESWSWQISLYYLAKYGEIKPNGHVIWIPKKGKPEHVLVSCKTKEQCEDLIKRFKDSKNVDNAN